jgi:hypothetical protein
VVGITHQTHQQVVVMMVMMEMIMAGVEKGSKIVKLARPIHFEAIRDIFSTAVRKSRYSQNRAYLVVCKGFK